MILHIMLLEESFTTLPIPMHACAHAISKFKNLIRTFCQSWVLHIIEQLSIWKFYTENIEKYYLLFFALILLCKILYICIRIKTHLPSKVQYKRSTVSFHWLFMYTCLSNCTLCYCMNVQNNN